jgi:NNP family nitrate/nitrite transporter-like MFS transporter
MVSLYDRLRSGGLSQHDAWRASFAIVPVPILLFVAILTLVYGTDCPAGKWSERHTLRATAVAVAKGHDLVVDKDEEDVLKKKTVDKEEQKSKVEVSIEEVVLDKEKARQVITADDEKRESPPEPFIPSTDHSQKTTVYQSEVDVAVNERLTFKSTRDILLSPLTWLPALSYITTFGFELGIDANLSHVIYDIYKSPNFGQTKAGYVRDSIRFLGRLTAYA